MYTLNCLAVSWCLTSPSICIACYTGKVWLLSGQFQWFYEAIPYLLTNWLPIHQIHPLINYWEIFEQRLHCPNFSWSLNTVACTAVGVKDILEASQKYQLLNFFSFNSNSNQNLLIPNQIILFQIFLFQFLLQLLNW